MYIVDNPLKLGVLSLNSIINPSYYFMQNSGSHRKPIEVSLGKRIERLNKSDFLERHLTFFQTQTTSNGFVRNQCTMFQSFFNFFNIPFYDNFNLME